MLFCFLSLVNFFDADNYFDPDSGFTRWYDLFLCVLKRHAPIRKKRTKPQKLPPWLTKEIVYAMSVSDRVREDFTKIKNFKKKAKFSQLYDQRS